LNANWQLVRNSILLFVDENTNKGEEKEEIENLLKN